MAPKRTDNGKAPELPSEAAGGTQGREAPNPQPGPHHYIPPPHHGSPWPWFWPDGRRADPGVLPAMHAPTWFVGRDTLPGGVLVSTVFLGLDHNFLGEGPPLLWETMVFDDGPESPMLVNRYGSREAALRGHALAVQAVQFIDGSEGDGSGGEGA